MVAEFQSRRLERRQRQRAGLSEAGVDPATAVQLEMLRTLRTMRRGNGGGGSCDEADDENNDGFLRRSKAGDINELLRLCKRLSERPLEAVMADRQRVMWGLGVRLPEGGAPSTPWQHTDSSHKIRVQFGKMTGLWRLHYAMAKSLTMAEQKRMDLLAGTLAQTLKAVHQAALDSGSWSNAVLLLPWQNPLQRELWAGEDNKMATAARYSRAIKDLSLKTQSTDGLGDGLEETPQAAAWQQRPPRDRPPKTTAPHVPKSMI